MGIFGGGKSAKSSKGMGDYSEAEAASLTNVSVGHVRGAWHQARNDCQSSGLFGSGSWGRGKGKGKGKGSWYSEGDY